MIVGVISAQGKQILLQDSAADAARLIARQDDLARAERVITTAVAGASLSVENHDDLICATATVTASIIVPLTLTARACALTGGQ